MLKLKTFSHAKKITQSLFSQWKNKEIKNVSQFRDSVAKEFGYKSLKDAFDEDHAKKRKELEDKYISFIDDPRITLDVAMEIGEDQDKAYDYFEKHIQYNNDGIMFPISSGSELLTRCEEILIIFNKIDWFSTKNLITAMYKVELPHGRVSYAQEGWGLKGNPELLMALKLFDVIKQMGIQDWIEFTDEDIEPETGYYDLRTKIRLLSRGIIWTQTNVGRSYHEMVLKEHDESMQEVKKEKRMIQIQQEAELQQLSNT